tara:strand:- start:382 stop:1116 length:735 start_codon:yes stop_codon:yes gene_type:complete
MYYGAETFEKLIMKNIDQEEVSKFDEIAEKWWDLEGEFKPLHQINPLRVGFINERTTLKGAKVLDIGCGGGILSESLSNLGAEVTGLDASEKTIGVARARSNKVGSNITFLQMTLEDYINSENEKEFDVITCLEMLEHVPDPSQIIKGCKSLLKKDGKVFFSTINRNPKSYLFAILGAEYILNLLPRGTHEFEKFIKPSELSRWIRNSGLKQEEVIGLSYNPLTNHYWLGEDIQVNYMVYASDE